MLGKLARKLRMLGIDTAYRNRVSQDDILNLAKAENRIILTRNALSAKTLPKGTFLFIDSNSPVEQLRQIISCFNISKDAINPFSRCICCNNELKPVDKEKIEGKVANYVYSTSDSFSKCPGCNKIYWHGTHHQNMTDTINDLFAGIKKT